MEDNNIKLMVGETCGIGIITTNLRNMEITGFHRADRTSFLESLLLQLYLQSNPHDVKIRIFSEQPGSYLSLGDRKRIHRVYNDVRVLLHDLEETHDLFDRDFLDYQDKHLFIIEGENTIADMTSEQRQLLSDIMSAHSENILLWLVSPQAHFDDATKDVMITKQGMLRYQNREIRPMVLYALGRRRLMEIAREHDEPLTADVVRLLYNVLSLWRVDM